MHHERRPRAGATAALWLVPLLGAAPMASAAAAATPHPAPATTNDAPHFINGGHPSAIAGPPRRPHSRIVGGRPVTQAVGWMAAVKVTTERGYYICGGTVISRDIVLTAQHCLPKDPKSITVHAGMKNWRNLPKPNVRTAVATAQGSMVNGRDWAVLKVDKKYYLSSYALPAAAPIWDTTASFRAMGWGATTEGGDPVDALREVDLPLVSDDECGPAASTEICAGDLVKGGVDTCRGDSGGPLLALTGAGLIQVGITSWGSGCGRVNSPGHYAQMSALFPEIVEAISSLEGEGPGAPGCPDPRPTSLPQPPPPRPTGDPSQPTPSRTTDPPQPAPIRTTQPWNPRPVKVLMNEDDPRWPTPFITPSDSHTTDRHGSHLGESAPQDLECKRL